MFLSELTANDAITTTGRIPVANRSCAPQVFPRTRVPELSSIHYDAAGAARPIGCMLIADNVCRFDCC